MKEDDLDSDENETNRGEEINDALDELDDMDLSQQTPASEDSYKPSQSQPSSSQHSFSQTSGDNEEVCLFYSRWILLWIFLLFRILQTDYSARSISTLPSSWFFYLSSCHSSMSAIPLVAGPVWTGR